MKKWLSILLMLPLCTLAQKGSNPQLFAKTITAEDLKKHLYIIAGPEMEGRETATPGQRKAAAYIENRFKQLGLQPGNKDSFQLFYNIYQDSLTSVTLKVNDQDYQLGKDFNGVARNFPATMSFSEVVLIGQDAADTLKNINLAGKLVMVISEPSVHNRNTNNSGINNILQNKGVAAVLIVSNSYLKNSNSNRNIYQTINPYKKALQPEQFIISEDVAKAIIGADYDNEKMNTSAIKTYNANVLLDIKKTTTILQSSDVIGLLPGTDLKDEYVVISAHYDHLGKRGDSVIYYGADDDGSGTVSVLEIAAAFAKAKAAGKGPRRSIIFLANSGEEKGLWGSEYYTSHPTFPLAQTSVDLNIDMIGRTDSSRKQGDSTNYVYVVGDDKLSSDLRKISEAKNQQYTRLELDYKFNDPNDKEFIYYRSDHYNFAKNGVPIIFYYDGMLGADYHKPTDTPDKINYKLMAKRAQLVFYTAWDMANRNDLLKRDIPLDTEIFSR